MANYIENNFTRQNVEEFFEQFVELQLDRGIISHLLDIIFENEEFEHFTPTIFLNFISVIFKTLIDHPNTLAYMISEFQTRILDRNYIFPKCQFRTPKFYDMLKKGFLIREIQTDYDGSAVYGIMHKKTLSNVLMSLPRYYVILINNKFLSYDGIIEVLDKQYNVYVEYVDNTRQITKVNCPSKTFCESFYKYTTDMQRHLCNLFLKVQIFLPPRSSLHRCFRNCEMIKDLGTNIDKFNRLTNMENVDAEMDRLHNKMSENLIISSKLPKKYSHESSDDEIISDGEDMEDYM